MFFAKVNKHHRDRKSVNESFRLSSRLTLGGHLVAVVMEPIFDEHFVVVLDIATTGVKLKFSMHLQLMIPIHIKTIEELQFLI